jgi:hypothetical protein
LGGALFNLDGQVILTNDTLAANTVIVGAGAVLGAADGGAVYNLAFGNDIDTGRPVTASLVLNNSILATSVGGNDLVSQAIDIKNAGTNTATVSGRNNLVISSDGTIGAGVITQTADPKLGTLRDNGGLTQTLLPASGSPVFDAGNTTLAPATDQRGQARPSNGPTDLGAVQVSVGTPTAGSSTGDTPTNGGSTSGGSIGNTPASAGLVGLAIEEFELTMDLLLASYYARTGIHIVSLDAAITQLQAAINGDPLLLTFEGQMAVFLGESLAPSSLDGR